MKPMKVKAGVHASIKLLLVTVCLGTSVNAQAACKTPDNQNGFCLPYQRCENYLKHIQSTRSPQDFNTFLMQSRCNSNRNIHICCGAVSSQPTPVTQRNTSTLNQQGLEVLNSMKTCGEGLIMKVSFGEVARLREFPWMALLEYDIPPPNQFQCGGSLITDRFVLTAAHCFKELYPIVAVILGEHDLDTDPDCQMWGKTLVCSPPSERYLVESFIPHPEYRKHLIGFDIALLKLQETVKFKEHINPICLPITSSSMEPQSSFVIAGWGTTENGSTSRLLKTASIEFKENSICENTYIRQRITSQHLCAGGDSPVDTCRGDSGEPLFTTIFYKPLEMRRVQFGIVSHGFKNCSAVQKTPGVFSNIQEFLPWITHNIL